MNSTGTEDVVVSEVLSGKITNWEVRKDDLEANKLDHVDWVIQKKKETATGKKEMEKRAEGIKNQKSRSREGTKSKKGGMW